MDMSSCSPSITTMIRMDHTHVMAAFHRYHAQTPWWRKRAIVELACTALEIHAQLEETIAKRKRILQQWEQLFHLRHCVIQKDIHSQLEETIAKHKEIKQQWQRFLHPKEKADFL